MPRAARTAQTVGDLVAALSRGDATRPVVTWVDVPTGDRVELSGATLANWVAKTGGFLQDGLDVAAGNRVRLSLPTHWLAVTWALGCWAVGAVVEPDDARRGVVGALPNPDVEVFGEDRDPRTAGRGVVVGLGPFGGPARVQPGGAADAGAEVLGHPDELFVHEPPSPSSPALLGADGRLVDHRGLLDLGRAAAGQVGLPVGGRLLAAAPPCDRAGLVHSVLAPLMVGGSVLLVRGRRGLEEAGGLPGLAAREGVDVTAPLWSRP